MMKTLGPNEMYRLMTIQQGNQQLSNANKFLQQDNIGLMDENQELRKALKEREAMLK